MSEGEYTVFYKKHKKVAEMCIPMDIAKVVPCTAIHLPHK